MSLLTALKELIFPCLLVVNAVVTGNKASDIYTNRYRCVMSCSLDGAYLSPSALKARSRLECAEACSKREWCVQFIFNASAAKSDLESLSLPCFLYMDDGSRCPNTAISAPAYLLCRKTNEATASSDECHLVPERVLQVMDTTTTILVDFTYLQSLMTAISNLKIQFVTAQSIYVTYSNYYTFGSGFSGAICVSSLDLFSASGNSTDLQLVRTFCTDGSQTVDWHNINLGSTIRASQFSWIVHRPVNGRSSTAVFTTGEDKSLLVTAVSSGFDIKLLFLGSNKIVHADVITYDMKSFEITAQTRMYEKEQLTLQNHMTKGLTEVTTWKPLTNTLTGPTSEMSFTTWLSDKCWKLVYSSAAVSTTSLNNLRSAVESGRRIRVKFTAPDLLILATADCLKIHSSGIITAFILRVLVQKASKSLIEGVVNTVGTILNSQAKEQQKWRHFMITSSGDIVAFTTTVGSWDFTVSTSTTTAEWFEEIGNWTLVHSSPSTSTSSLSLLVAKVLEGRDIRVNVQIGQESNWFTCDMTEVLNRGK